MLGRDYLCSWGFSWVPFFFMLAGLVLTHARLSSSKQPDSAAGFVAKRAATIYPLYSAGLAAALLLRVGQGRQLPEWWALPARRMPKPSPDTSEPSSGSSQAARWDCIVTTG